MRVARHFPVDNWGTSRRFVGIETGREGNNYWRKISWRKARQIQTRKTIALKTSTTTIFEVRRKRWRLKDFFRRGDRKSNVVCDTNPLSSRRIEDSVLFCCSSVPCRGGLR